MDAMRHPACRERQARNMAALRRHQPTRLTLRAVQINGARSTVLTIVNFSAIELGVHFRGYMQNICRISVATVLIVSLASADASLAAEPYRSVHQHTPKLRAAALPAIPIAKLAAAPEAADGCAMPQRSAEAAANGDSGTTQLLMLVRPDGTVEQAKVTASSGSASLDQTTLDAYSACRYVPMEQNGRQVTAWFPLSHQWPEDSSYPVRDIHCAKPLWPKQSFMSREEGTSYFSFEVGEDGTVKAAELRKSSGYPSLDAAAALGLRKCTYRPSLNNGRPVAVWISVAYRWTHDD